MYVLDFVTLKWHNMNKKLLNLSFKVILFTCILFPAFYLFGETFVIAKQSKKKAPPVSKLKELCCEECAAILELTPELLRVIADVHQMVLKNLRSYLDDGKEGFIAAQSKAQLMASHEKLKAMRVKLETLCNEVRECESFLENGYLKVGIDQKSS
jgi:hypothetical protein